LEKAVTYLWYLIEYLKFGDIRSVANAVSYLLFKKSHSTDRILKTSTGLYFCRKQTNDFQFANFRYEWNVKQFVLDRISEYNVFIDGGACNGEYSIWLAQNGYRCFAFEPVQSNFEVILKNIELNHLDEKVKAFPYGLGDKKSELRIAFNPINTGASSLKSDQFSGEPMVAKIDTFDSFLPQLNINLSDKILFKLDVEGMEAEAIAGTTKLVSSFDEVLFLIEVKHSGRQKVVDALNTLGRFEIGDIDSLNIYARKIGNHIK
jgi:methyltransferase, FkbM family